MGIRLTRVYDPAYTICGKAFITCISVTVPAPNYLAADVFGIGIFSLKSRASKHVLSSGPAPPFSFVCPHFLTPKI